MEQLINKDAVHKAAFLDYFSAVCRYQDDKWCGDSTHMSKAQYNTRYWGLTVSDVVGNHDDLHPLKGIYPDHLNIKNEQTGTHMVHYLDLSIQKVPVAQGAGVMGGATYKFKTAVYNKRSEAVYKDLPMVVYPQKDTMLAAQCKFGIVYSQAHRFMQRCTFRSDFDSAVIELVVYLINEKGYTAGIQNQGYFDYKFSPCAFVICPCNFLEVAIAIENEKFHQILQAIALG